MKSIIKIAVFFFCCFINYSCQQQNNERNKSKNESEKRITDEENKFHQNGIAEQIQNKLSDNNSILKLFNTKDIKIETENEDIINILQIICKSDIQGNLYFLGLASEIYKVSPKGKLLKKIHYIGRGAGEYLGLTDICIDEELNIYVLDNKQKIIIKYNSSFKYLFSINCDKYKISKIEINDDGNLIAFIPNAKKNSLIEFNKNNGEKIIEFGEHEFKTKNYGYPFFLAGSMSMSKKHTFYIFPLSYQLFIIDNNNITNVISYRSSHFPEVNEIILLSRTKTKYSVIYKLFHLTEEVFLISMLSYGERELGKSYHSYEVVSIYGDIIKEKISYANPIRIYGQMETGKLISVFNKETDGKIDTYIRILDFNLD